MSRHWTPEQRAAFGEKMRQARAHKRENSEHLLNKENVIETDIPSPVRRPYKKREPASIKVAANEKEFSPQDLIRRLQGIPLVAVSYSDCGLLLNALSACSNAVALARREKQEQLDAGTHRAPCKTCGRMIDISKSGGFQILTERDEHFMPRNSYYCSQNCLLARNMPSHAKQTPKEKKENRA